MIGHNRIEDGVFRTYDNFTGYTGDAPTSEAEYMALLEEQGVFNGSAPSWTEVHTKISNEKARKLRKNEYPPVEDYLDGIVKGDQAQIDEYISECLAVKAKYPIE